MDQQKVVQEGFNERKSHHKKSAPFADPYCAGEDVHLLAMKALVWA